MQPPPGLFIALQCVIAEYVHVSVKKNFDLGPLEIKPLVGYISRIKSTLVANFKTLQNIPVQRKSTLIVSSCFHYLPLKASKKRLGVGGGGCCAHIKSVPLMNRTCGLLALINRL